MAYVANQDDQEDEKNQGQPAGQAGERVLSSGGSGTVDGGTPGAASSGGAAATPAAGTGRSGTGWTNLQTYVSANQGADQPMADKVAGQAKDEADQAGVAEGNYGALADQAVSAGTVGDDSAARAAAGKAVGASGALTADQAASLGRQAKATYGGPVNSAGIANYGDTNAAVQKVQKTADAAGDFEGRGQLLDQAYGRPSYTAGERNFDSFLLGSGDAGQKAIQGIQSGAQTTKSGWDALTKHVDQSASDAAQTSASNAAAAKSALGGAESNFGNYFDQKSAAAASQTSAAAAKYDSYVNGIKSKDPATSAAAWRSVGVDPAAGANYIAQGGDPNKIYQRAQAQGLGDLVDANTQSAYGAVEQATGNAPKYTFDKTGAAAPVGANRAVIGQVNDLGALKAKFDRDVATDNASRAGDFKHIQSALGQNGDDWLHELADTIGVSPGELAQLKDGGASDADIANMVTQGRAVTAADVASDAERAKWAGLSSALGLNPGASLTPTSPVGKGWNFDEAAFGNYMQKGKAAQDAAAQAAAAQAAAEKQQADQAAAAEAAKQQAAQAAWDKSPYNPANSATQPILPSGVNKSFPVQAGVAGEKINEKVNPVEGEVGKLEDYLGQGGNPLTKKNLLKRIGL